jgi:hypothetical protein
MHKQKNRARRWGIWDRGTWASIAGGGFVVDVLLSMAKKIIKKK